MSKQRRKQDDFDVLSRALQKYMRKQGWEIVVLSGPSVQQYPSDLKFNYELVFRFTGSRLEEREEK